MTQKSDSKKIRVTLLKSLHGQLKMHRDNMRGLGLSRRHQSVERAATPEILGMVHASSFMVKVEGI